jgi:hypothetical protein
MKTEPFNKKLHALLIAKNYKYSEHIHYDRYDLNKITVFYYLNGYTMILNGSEPVSKRVSKEILSNMEG